MAVRRDQSERGPSTRLALCDAFLLLRWCTCATSRPDSDSYVCCFHWMQVPWTATWSFKVCPKYKKCTWKLKKSEPDRHSKHCTEEISMSSRYVDGYAMRRYLDGGLWEVESGRQLRSPRARHVVLAAELSFKSRELISRERRPVSPTVLSVVAHSSPNQTLHPSITDDVTQNAVSQPYVTHFHPIDFGCCNPDCLSYFCFLNNNLDRPISNRSRVSCACTQYVEGINSKPVTLKSGLTVTQGHWNWYHSKVRYDFLFAFYSNNGVILYCVRNIAIYWSKIATFLYPTLYLAPLQEVTPSEFRQCVWYL